MSDIHFIAMPRHEASFFCLQWSGADELHLDTFLPLFHLVLNCIVEHNYYVYITTNPGKEVLYIGVTNNLAQRIIEHYLNRGNPKTFAGRYYCYLLVHWEYFKYIDKAIEREKQLKGWSRKKKLDLIKAENPKLFALNPSIISPWPPVDGFIRSKE